MLMPRLTGGLAAFIMAGLVTLGGVTSVQAEMTPKELQVAARSLAFLTGREISALKVAIIYSPDIAASKHEAEALAAQLGSAFNAGRVTLVAVPPVSVNVGELPQLDGKDVAFVTDGLKAWYPAIAAASKPRHLVTVTSDFDCVAGGFCVLGVQAEPRVQVLINRALAQQSSIEFAPGFRLLVTEL